MLARHHQVLRNYARRYIPDPSDALIDEVAGRVVDTLLAMDSRPFRHGLLYARRIVKRECHRVVRAKAHKGGELGCAKAGEERMMR